MQYFVILTKECNLFCAYCGGGSDTPPKEIQYSLEELQSFLSKDPDPILEFYGGEPLLRMAVMKKIVNGTRGRFALQTNGTFLDRVEPRLLRKLQTILVSIDGTESVTDRERGKGVYQRAMRNVAAVRETGYRGDVVARMTVVQGSDIFESVTHLLGAGLFDHVHWQLSFSMFWRSDVTEPGLQEWLSRYNAGVSSLVAWWVDEMERTGVVPGIVPFIGITRSLLSGTKAGLRCGSGDDFYAIMPDGRISACPVSVDFDFSVVGSLRTHTPESLPKVKVGEPCTSCDIFGICGGRCLFVNQSQGLLRDGAYAEICGTVKHLVSELQRALPRVRALVDGGRIRGDDFLYPEFNNGCEIIP
ncbi:MAG: TIGR04084 family radical SAM/SPASM domain-containing protein [Nitrososphaerota archaeon]|jgi:putative peptide-modifying radical SAM enzyme|nr:TIGR04084 family radical SAM/SPASM domain-containing protein [Nitrososphaerota archaeon]MDG6993485.1 TIGR04084 family radical SAM/SPASM domain-containing protein [Nitrososphaerota archaeon]MDG7004374.1 TIGR04084 family radical SAM/SPASM domain-containing protein [Nitrososphaerota archaeon]